MLFALLSLASIVGWRMWQRRHPDESDQPMLNRRAEQYIGRVFVLEAAIENGFGKVRVADSLWRVKGPDAPVGSRVRVTAADGIILVVEPAD
jgi:membrane protein implicated in regulation of membrane protease activity